MGVAPPSGQDRIMAGAETAVAEASEEVVG
jgi:hypothetical protein